MEITRVIIVLLLKFFRNWVIVFWKKIYQRAMRMDLGPGGLNTEIESDIQFQYKTKLLVITRQTF